MDNLSKNLCEIMFGSSEPINFGNLRIDLPDDLPPELATQLACYNEAIGNVDIERAEEAANQILKWFIDPK